VGRGHVLARGQVRVGDVGLDGPGPGRDVEGPGVADEGEGAAGRFGTGAGRVRGGQLGGFEDDAEDEGGTAEVRVGLDALEDGEEVHGVVCDAEG